MQIVPLRRKVSHELRRAERLVRVHHRAEEGAGARDDAGYKGVLHLQRRALGGAAADFLRAAAGARYEGVFEVGGAEGDEGVGFEGGGEVVDVNHEGVERDDRGRVGVLVACLEEGVRMRVDGVVLWVFGVGSNMEAGVYVMWDEFGVGGLEEEGKGEENGCQDDGLCGRLGLF